MLRRIYIDNYRCFSNFEWRPGQISLIAGRNGSGKSSLLDALNGISGLLVQGGPTEDFFSIEDLTRWDSRTDQVFELDVTTGGHDYRYRLVVDQLGEDETLCVRSEELSLTDPMKCLFNFHDGQVHLFREDGSAGPVFPADGSRSALAAVPAQRDNLLLSAFKDHARRYWWIAPVPSAMIPEASTEAFTPNVDLANFVAWYRSVSGDSVRVSELNRELATVLDGFLGLRLIDSGRRTKLLQAVFSGRSGPRRKELVFDFDELSDGQRVLIALYALLVFGPVNDGVLCLDEPDNYVSLREIQPWLRALEDRVSEGDGQVILVSHHPEVINRLWQGHGVIFEHELEGPVRARDMEAYPELAPAEVIAGGME